MAGVLKDGFKTLIGFALVPNLYLSLPEKEVTPPGQDGGGMIDITTMRNTAWRTRWHKSLKTLTDVSFTAAYAVQAHLDLLTMINANQLITVAFPDTSTISFYGWLNEFKPNSNREGEQPTASCVIIPSNLNAAGNEAAPVFNLV